MDRRPRRALLLAASLAGACAAGAGCPGDSIGTGREPVIHGSVTPSGLYPATGALLIDDQGTVSFYCTGTLVAPDVVLTAAHCVDPLFIGDLIPSFTLALDANDPPRSQIVSGMASFEHPQFELFTDPGDGLGHWFDVGVVLLAEPVTTVEPERLPSPAEGAALAAGADVEIVGYGLTVGGGTDAGIKMNAETVLADVGDFELMIGNPGDPQNCQGDSGGPAFAGVGTDGEHRLVGIVSRGPKDGAETCDKGGIDTRVDAYLEWIDEVATIPCGSGLSDPCPEPDAGPVDVDGGGTSADDDDDGGGTCGCRAGGRASGLPAALLLVVATLAVRRRRRRSRS